MATGAAGHGHPLDQGHTLDLRAQIIDNASFLYPNIPALNFKVLIGEENEIFRAHLADIDSTTSHINAILMTAESERHEDNDYFADPRVTILVLLIKTAREVERKISRESSNDDGEMDSDIDGDIDVDDTD